MRKQHPRDSQPGKTSVRRNRPAQLSIKLHTLNMYSFLHVSHVIKKNTHSQRRNPAPQKAVAPERTWMGLEGTSLKSRCKYAH